MRLIHASSIIQNKSFKYKRFIPRTPQLRCLGENDNLKRICFSDDIRKCLNAMSDGCMWGYYITENLRKKPLGYGIKGQMQDRFKIPALFDVFELDTNNIGKYNILNPLELYRKEYVKDCLENSEYWIMDKPITLSKTKTIRYVDISLDLKMSKEIDREFLYTDILIEGNIESFERCYSYAFIEKEGINKMLKILKNLKVTNIENKIIYNDINLKINLLSFIVPPYTDMESIWRFYFHYSIKEFSKLNKREQDLLSCVVNKI